MTLRKLANKISTNANRSRVRMILDALIEEESMARLHRGTVLTLNSEFFDCLEIEVQKRLREKARAGRRLRK